MAMLMIMAMIVILAAGACLWHINLSKGKVQLWNAESPKSFAGQAGRFSENVL